MLKIATEEDFDLILKFAKNFSATIEQADIVEEDTLKEIIRSFLNASNDERIILLHGTDGMLAAMKQSFVLGTAPIAFEFAWWVEPESRKKNIGRELVEAFEFWAKKLNCKYTIMSCYANNDLGKFYESCGYTLYEKAYLKECNAN